MALTKLIAGAVLLPAAFVLGCASNPEPVGGGTDTAARAAGSLVTVVNNHSSARQMIIYLEPQGRGQRETLGTVEPGATQAFAHSIANGYYRLTAAHDLGEIESNSFNVQAASNIRWVLNSDRVTVSTR